jgi:hypothetical protein
MIYAELPIKNNHFSIAMLVYQRVDAAVDDDCCLVHKRS